VLVKVTASDGTVGWGEATPTPAWTYETAESIVSTIERYLAPVTIGRLVWDVDGLTRLYDRVINRGVTIGAPLAKSAVDVALHDLIGRSLGVSVGVLWGARRTEWCSLAWIISAEGSSGAAESVKEGLDLGYHAFKIKIGLHGEAEDAAMVAAVRRATGDRCIWVDANQGYTIDVAVRQSRRISELGVELFEQPLPANDIAGLRRLRDLSPIPIAVDESVRHPSDLATFLKLDAIDVAIVKYQKSGGLTLARRFCALAEDGGIRMVGSGLTESDLGLAASLHLFAAFGITLSDLNGRQFIESPYITGQSVVIDGGRATLPQGPGLGVDVDEDAVRSLAVDL
jgi:muconate cycloisomerase